jgi:hypothetical protein
VHLVGFLFIVVIADARNHEPEMLELFALLRIDDIEQEEGEILFLQDSVPPLFSHEVLNALDVIFPNWWFGRGRKTSWPTCSQDISLLSFFQWGFVKNIIYVEKIQFYIICGRKLTQV